MEELLPVRFQRLNMNYTAEANNLKISPRKMRLVVDGVKNMPLIQALAVLTVGNTRASSPIKKALQSAMANAVHNGKVNKEDLMISSMFVTEGVSNKRFHFAGRGRTRPYKKRTSHLKVILGVREGKALVAPKAEIKTEVKEEKKKGGAPKSS